MASDQSCPDCKGTGYLQVSIYDPATGRTITYLETCWCGKAWNV